MIGALEIEGCVELVLSLNARLLKLAWMGRFWTFQESYLAERLLVQLVDGTFEPNVYYVPDKATSSGKYDDWFRNLLATTDT